MVVANTLAYYNTSTITNVKSFTVKGTNFTQTIEKFVKLVDKAIKEYFSDSPLMERLFEYKHLLLLRNLKVFDLFVFRVI